MDPDVPLLIPEVNPDHLDALAVQRKRTGGGYIVTNPNCSVVGLAMALAPLQRAVRPAAKWRWPRCRRSPAPGYPGVASMDIADNVIPYIGGGEEEKIETEPLRILGTFTGGAFAHAPFRISASVHRVAVTDGHTMAVFVRLKTKATAAAGGGGHRLFPRRAPGAQAPHRAAAAHPRAARRTTGPSRASTATSRAGWPSSVGRVRADKLFDLKLEVLVHNTIRGAAGAAILNAELLKARDLLP